MSVLLHFFAPVSGQKCKYTIIIKMEYNSKLRIEFSDKQKQHAEYFNFFILPILVSILHCCSQSYVSLFAFVSNAFCII